MGHGPWGRKESDTTERQSIYQTNTGSLQQGVFWKYLLLKFHWWGFQSLSIQKGRSRGKSTRAPSSCWVSLPSSQARGLGGSPVSPEPRSERHSRAVQLGFKKKNREESSQTLLQTGQIFVLEFKLKLWGWIRCPEVIQTAKPEVVPGL